MPPIKVLITILTMSHDHYTYTYAPIKVLVSILTMSHDPPGKAHNSSPDPTLT